MILFSVSCPSPGRAAAAELNLLLVTIDTLRPDRLSCYNPKYARTPAIDAVAASGALFEKAFAHTSVTLPSHANIFLGTTPVYHGVSENSKSKVAGAFLTLAEHLKSYGYATGAFVGAFPLDSRFGLDQGFDVYDDSFPTKSPLGDAYSEKKAEQVVASALGWLSKQKGKWFCWVHLWDPHAPYAPPEPFLTRYKSDLYSGEAAYADAELGKLFAEIQRKGWAGKTITIVTADHGESLGEHGELTHGYFAYNSTIHVPLVIAGPGIPASRIGDFVGHIDIFPTVSEMLDVEKPSFLQGQSLVPWMKGKKGKSKAVYFEALDAYLNKGCAPLRGFIEDGRKFMDSPVPELYDLNRDFAEKENLAGKTGLVPYQRKFAEMKKSLSSPLAEKATQAVDREAQERLRSLGYVVSPVTKLKAAYGPEDDLKNFLPFQTKLEAAIVKGDQGKTGESVELLESLIRERRDFVPAYLYLSQFYGSLGRRQDALRVMEAGCSENPDDYSLLSTYGAFLVQTYQYDPAAEVLEKALSIIDFDPEVWNNLGFIAWRKGDFEKALEHYHRAVALDKTFAPAFSNLGMLYLSLSGENRREENLALSIENFEKATSLDPAMNLAFRGLGVALKTAGKTGEALVAWEKAVVINPEDGYSVNFLAEAYLEKGEKERALRYLQKYLEVKGDRLSPEEKEKIQELIRRCK